MTRQRNDEYLIEVEIQSDLHTEGSGTPLVLEPISADPSGIKKNLIADKRSTGRKKGTLAPIAGLFKGVNSSFAAYAEGIRAVATESSPAVQTACSALLAAVAQNQTLTKSSVVTGTPTVTSVDESVNDGHLTAAPNGSTAAITMAGFTLADGVHVRPASYNAASDTMTLKFELPSAPAGGSVIVGGAVSQKAEQWTSLPYPLTVRYLGNDDEQHAKAIGAVPVLSIPELDVENVPELNFKIVMADGESGFSDTRPTLSDVPEVSVWAGGEVLLGLYGDDTYQSVCAKVAIESLGSEPQWMSCPGGPSNRTGCQDFVRGPNVEKITITIPEDVMPDDLGATLTRWLDIVEDPDAGADKEWHCQVQCGFTAGRIFAGYFPRLILQSASKGTLDGMAAHVLVFEPHPFMVEPAFVTLLS